MKNGQSKYRIYIISQIFRRYNEYFAKYSDNDKIPDYITTLLPYISVSCITHITLWYHQRSSPGRWPNFKKPSRVVAPREREPPQRG